MAQITVLHQGKKLEEHEISIALTKTQQGLVTALKKHLGNVPVVVTTYNGWWETNCVYLHLPADGRDHIRICDGRTTKPVTAIWFQDDKYADKQIVAHTPKELVRLIRPEEVEPLLPPTALGRVLALFRRFKRD